MRPEQTIDSGQNCAAIEELIPEYAFGLTDSAETRLVDSQLSNCPEAKRQLADYQRMQDEMRASVPQIEPSAQLAARLMAAIATPAQPQVTASAPSVNVPEKTAPRRVRWRWVAAAAAVLVLVLTNIFWLLRVNDLTRKQDELLARLGEPGTNAFVLANTSELRWVRLPPSQQDGSAAAFMMWNGESKIGILYAHAFPQLAAGQTYILWLARGQNFVRAGTVQVDKYGKGALLFHIDEPIDKFTWACISAEPTSYGDSPTTELLVSGKLTT